MKKIIILIPFLPAAGMALFPFILVKTAGLKTNKTIINHENIHLHQQRELLLIPFYIIYLIHYFLNLLYYLKHDKAYRNIVFEREAYIHERDFQYLGKRKRWAWIRFFSSRYASK